MLQSSRTVMLSPLGMMTPSREAADGIVEAQLFSAISCRMTLTTNVLVLLPMRKWSAGVKGRFVRKIGITKRAHEARAVGVPDAD